MTLPTCRRPINVRLEVPVHVVNPHDTVTKTTRAKPITVKEKVQDVVIPLVLGVVHPPAAHTGLPVIPEIEIAMRQT